MTTIPDPAIITVENAPKTVLFPGEALDRVFGQGYDGHAPPLFGPMWEYSGRRNYTHVFMTRELLNLLHILKQEGLIRGVQAEFGCSPWPATNIWFEAPEDIPLPEDAIYALTEAYWSRKYASELSAIKAIQSAYPAGNSDITRLLVDCHFMVHQLAIELPDGPITAEMDLRAFNNPSDVVHERSGNFTNAVHIGYRMGTNPETIARLRQLNEISFESARKRLSAKRNEDWIPEEPFIDGAILSSILNYIPWKSFLKKLDEYLLPGSLMVVYNAQEGERAHQDWKNITENQEAIAAFIQNDLGYTLRIHELRNAGGPVTPLYLVAQKVKGLGKIRAAHQRSKCSSLISWTHGHCLFLRP